MVLLERTQVEEKREGRKDSYGWSCHTARRKVSTASVAMKGFRSKQETAMDGAAVDPPPPPTSFLIFGFIVGFSLFSLLLSLSSQCSVEGKKTKRFDWGGDKSRDWGFSSKTPKIYQRMKRESVTEWRVRMEKQLLVFSF